MSRKNLAACFVALLILAAGCTSKDLHSLKEMSPLQTALVKKYKATDVRLTIWNGNSLSIAFINSPFNDLSEKEKQLKAVEIARFVKNQSTLIKDLQTVSIGFVVYKNYFVFDYTNSLNSYFFNTQYL